MLAVDHLIIAGCPAGTYGDGCIPCPGYCKYNISCHYVNAKCDLGCHQWYAGDKCDVYLGTSRITIINMHLGAPEKGLQRWLLQTLTRKYLNQSPEDIG